MGRDSIHVSSSLQRTIRYDIANAYVPQSDRVSHWHLLDKPPAPESVGPVDPNFRRYTRKVVRFASEMVKAKALVALDTSILADVASSCLDGSIESTGYWFEVLALRCLQVRLSSSCVCCSNNMVCLHNVPAKVLEAYH
jgi:hypothetical protein